MDENNSFSDHAFTVIVQIRVGGLPPISNCRKELKLRGNVEHFYKLRGVLKSEEVPITSV